MIKNNIKKNKGFVLLFSILISSMILMIALGMVNIAYKEIRFGTSVKESNEAFFAADTGAECVLYNDKNTSTSFIVGGSGLATCLSNVSGNIVVNGIHPNFDFVLSGLGSASQGCAKVTVTKGALTAVTSLGYNNGGSEFGFCSPTNTSLERRLDLTY